MPCYPTYHFPQRRIQRILTSTYDGSISIIPKMSKDGTWGGHIELQALSRVLMWNVSIYNDSKEYIVIEVSHTVAPNPICIAYNRSKPHYSSLNLFKKDNEENVNKESKEFESSFIQVGKKAF